MERVILLSLLVSGLVGAAIGESRGRLGAGFVLGLLIGPIGWLLVAVGPNLKTPAAEPVTPETKAPQSPGAALLELRQLFEAGAITAEEYEEKRKVWLDRI